MDVLHLLKSELDFVKVIHCLAITQVTAITISIVRIDNYVRAYLNVGPWGVPYAFSAEPREFHLCVI